MTWFAASVILHVRFKDGNQSKFPVWENVLLIDSATASEALMRAESIGKNGEGDSGGSFTWEGRPAEWICAGVRKLVAVSNPDDIEDAPGDGAEITYSQFEVDDEASLQRLARGEEVNLRYLEESGRR